MEEEDVKNTEEKAPSTPSAPSTPPSPITPWHKPRRSFSRRVLFPEGITLGEVSAACGIGSFMILIANSFSGHLPTTPRTAEERRKGI
jgi:hypothetical protein